MRAGLRGAAPFLAFGLALVAATPCVSAGSEVSDFYRWDGALPDEPGRLLRSEPLPEALRIDGADEQSRILYSSTDGLDGQPSAVSGMLLVPEGTPPKGGWPLLAWAHGTTGIADVCAPSWRGTGSAVAGYLQAWLDEGYAVVATDYQGLGTPGLHLYLATRPAAHSVLDSIRAAGDARGDIGGTAVIAGQSQGGGAAFASGALAAQYAPELEISAVIASGVPYLTADMPTASTVPSDQVDPGLAYVFYVAHVATALASDLDPSELFAARALPVYEQAAELCIGELMSTIRDAGLTQANTMQPGAVERMAQTLLAHYVYPTVELDMPVFVATGTEDRDVDPRAQLMLVRDACAAGTLVKARLYAGQGHTGAWLAAQESAIGFAEAARHGETIEADCAPAPIPPR